MTQLSPFEGKRLALFDLDGTLRKVLPSRLETLISYAGDLGLTIDKKSRRAAIRWSHKFWATNEKRRRDMDRAAQDTFFENYLQQYLVALGIVDSEAGGLAPRISTRFREEFKPEPYLVAGAKEILWNLRDDGLKIGLVSNRSEPLTGLAIELDIIEHFNFTLSAGQVNSWKPDAGIFQRALALGGNVPPGEAVYIGDNYYTDIIGAQKIGISAVLVDEEGAFPKAKEECLVVTKLSELKSSVAEASGPT